MLVVVGVIRERLVDQRTQRARGRGIRCATTNEDECDLAGQARRGVVIVARVLEAEARELPARRREELREPTVGEVEAVAREALGAAGDRGEQRGEDVVVELARLGGRGEARRERLGGGGA